MIISFGTIVSSLNSDRLTRALGTGKVTALSVAMTAAALFGFSVSSAFWMLCLWAIPYGLGAGSVDAALNNYVALHYESRHMSWLHCMWGVGTIISPVLMSLALTGGQGWNGGYHIVALIQVRITAVLVLSLPLWKGRPAAASADGTPARPLTLPQILAIPGVREVMFCFFCYCGLETTAGLWASSYLTLSKGVPADTAAAFAGLFYLGITVGRGFCGFVTLRFNDTCIVFSEYNRIDGTHQMLFRCNKATDHTICIFVKNGHACIVFSFCCKVCRIKFCFIYAKPAFFQACFIRNVTTYFQPGKCCF